MSYSEQTTNGVTVINDNGKITVNGKSIDGVVNPTKDNLVAFLWWTVGFIGGVCCTLLYQGSKILV